jgi:hypothetical protein
MAIDDDSPPFAASSEKSGVGGSIPSLATTHNKRLNWRFPRSVMDEDRHPATFAVEPTQDSFALIADAIRGTRSLWRQGTRHWRAAVILDDLHAR